MFIRSHSDTDGTIAPSQLKAFPHVKVNQVANRISRVHNEHVLGFCIMPSNLYFIGSHYGVGPNWALLLS